MATISKRGTMWQVRVRRQGQQAAIRMFQRKVDTVVWARPRKAEADRGSF